MMYGYNPADNTVHGHRILCWAVGFQTPLGTFDDFETAAAALARCDLLPDLIEPVVTCQYETPSCRLGSTDLVTPWHVLGKGGVA